MRKYLLLISVILLSIGVYGQNTLNIHQKDGSKFSYGFTENPIVTYEGNTLKVSTETVSIEFPLTNLDKLSFEDELTKIDLLHIEGKRSDILIYNQNGVLLKRIQNNNGISETSISELPKGVYIIKKEYTTFKILKR